MEEEEKGQLSATCQAIRLQSLTTTPPFLFWWNRKRERVARVRHLLSVSSVTRLNATSLNDVLFFCLFFFSRLFLYFVCFLLHFALLSFSSISFHPFSFFFFLFFKWTATAAAAVDANFDHRLLFRVLCLYYDLFLSLYIILIVFFHSLCCDYRVSCSLSSRAVFLISQTYRLSENESNDL